VKVHAWQDGISMVTNIVLYEERNGKRFVCQPVELVFKELDDEETGCTPTLKLNSLFAMKLKEGFLESLSDLGFKSKNEDKLEGTLEATKKHLEDMRRLVLKEAYANP
jgi:hypothetical protein